MNEAGVELRAALVCDGTLWCAMACGLLAVKTAVIFSGKFFGASALGQGRRGSCSPDYSAVRWKCLELLLILKKVVLYPKIMQNGTCNRH